MSRGRLFSRVEMTQWSANVSRKVSSMPSPMPSNSLRASVCDVRRFLRLEMAFVKRVSI